MTDWRPYQPPRRDGWNTLEFPARVWVPDEAEVVAIARRYLDARDRLTAVLVRELHARGLLRVLSPGQPADLDISINTAPAEAAYGEDVRGWSCVASEDHAALSWRGYVPAAIVLAAELWGDPELQALSTRLSAQGDARLVRALPLAQRAESQHRW